MNRRLVDVGSARLECLTFGRADHPPLVVETSLGGSMAEWYHIALTWSDRFMVILYNRAGYGASSPSSLPRSPTNVVAELENLLAQLVGERPVVYVGHSYGGLPGQILVRTRPARVARIVFIDPMSLQDHRIMEQLSPAQYAASGWDKSANLKLGRTVCRLGLGWLLRPLLRKAPPFFYHPDFSPEATRDILRNATSASMYAAALEEYRMARDPALATTLEAGMAGNRSEGLGCFDGEVVLFAHDPAGMQRDIMHYGGTDAETAEIIDGLWQAYMREVMTLSCHSRRVQSRSGSHFLHLTDTETLTRLIAD